VWAKTVLFITYDENDGFFDHVPPPTAPPGTDGEWITAPLPDDAGGIAGPTGLGFRVPMLVISPWSRGGWVASQAFDHTSRWSSRKQPPCPRRKCQPCRPCPGKNPATVATPADPCAQPGETSAGLPAAECRTERRRADVPHVVGDVDRDSGGNDLVDAIKHVGGQLDPVGGEIAV